MLIKAWRSAKLRDRMRLVVAKRLQVQHHSFRLRTSSNTPFVPMSDAHGSFANFDEEIRFPSCNFYLKKHLDELAQFKTRLQFGRAHQPIKTNPRFSFNAMKYESCECFLALRWVSFRPDIAMLKQKVLRVQNKHG
jgi:hypothetical protein